MQDIKFLFLQPAMKEFIQESEDDEIKEIIEALVYDMLYINT
jgi:hypothetical protein